MASIELSKIEKDFPGVRALRDIDLSIESGEFFTLLGPSGCGKTTLLRVVAGFYRQDRGHVFIDGKTIDRVPAYARNTGMVFQNYAVFPHMSVFENVAFGLRNRKVAAEEIRRRVDRVLEMARLQGLEKRTPDQLSGGQQQRVGLARAMVIEPQVLLMDEPLSNLDAKLRIEMREEIRDIQRELRTTTVYVTHDQEEALVISDRIAVMNAGVVEQIGTPWEIYQRPQTVFVAGFVGHMNFVEGMLERRDAKTSIRLDAGAFLPLTASTAQLLEETGGAPLVGVRPEDIEIFDEGPDPERGTTLACTVIKSSFTGSLVKYTLKTDSGVILLAERYRPIHGGTIPVGRPVFAHLGSENVHYFDKEKGMRIGGRR